MQLHKGSPRIETQPRPDAERGLALGTYNERHSTRPQILQLDSRALPFVRPAAKSHHGGNPDNWNDPQGIRSGQLMRIVAAIHSYWQDPAALHRQIRLAGKGQGYGGN